VAPCSGLQPLLHVPGAREVTSSVRICGKGNGVRALVDGHTVVCLHRGADGFGRTALLRRLYSTLLGVSASLAALSKRTNAAKEEAEEGDSLAEGGRTSLSSDRRDSSRPFWKLLVKCATGTEDMPWLLYQQLCSAQFTMLKGQGRRA